MQYVVKTEKREIISELLGDAKVFSAKGEKIVLFLIVGLLLLSIVFGKYILSQLPILYGGILIPLANF